VTGFQRPAGSLLPHQPAPGPVVGAMVASTMLEAVMAIAAAALRATLPSALLGP